MGRHYLTTAIFYPNAVPHLGTAYEVIGADAAARWRRLRGDEVFFLSGNDEHALKVAQVAAERGEEPLAYCDAMAAAFERAWRALDISYDEYIRTSQRRHHDTVAWFLGRIRDGDARRVARGEPPVLYKGTYEGLYCVGCEAFLREKDLVRGLCPHHPGRTPQKLVEENWFFRLSAYADDLREHFARRPGWLRPESAAREMAALLAEGLQDISVSRPRKTLAWGIPFPGEPEHVVYVWFEALVNYVSGARLAPDGSPRPAWPGRSGPGCWPADLHVIGKDIVRFHALIWPAMLLAADLELPRAVFVHGFVQVGGAKISKSAGGGRVSPVDLAGEWGADVLRYFLLREVAWGQDGEFSLERLEDRYQADLANTLGNLLHRTLTMIEKYAGGVVPDAPADAAIIEVGRHRDECLRRFDALEFAEGLDSLAALARGLNGAIEAAAPWKLAKDPATMPRVHALLRALAEGLASVAVLLSPVMPAKAREIARSLGIEDHEFDALRLEGPAEDHKDTANLTDGRSPAAFAALDALGVAGRTVRKGAPLFPRRDAAPAPGAQGPAGGGEGNRATGGGS